MSSYDRIFFVNSVNLFLGVVFHHAYEINRLCGFGPTADSPFYREQALAKSGYHTPYYEIRGKISNQRVWTFLFSKTSKLPTTPFTLNVISNYLGTIGRLGELILMFKKLSEIFMPWYFYTI